LREGGRRAAEQAKLKNVRLDKSGAPSVDAKVNAAVSTLAAYIAQTSVEQAAVRGTCGEVAWTRSPRFTPCAAASGWLRS